MDDLQFGTRDKRGNWSPKDPAEVAPIWEMPPKFGKILRWLPQYVFPYDILWVLSALAWWDWV